jgi:ribosomal protein L11 methyltransferase
LGAAHVVAVDLDPQALLSTRENARRNEVAEQIIVQGIESALTPAHGITANILAEPLIELAPKLTAACEPAGFLLLSGLLKTQAYAVKAAYSPGFDMVHVIEKDEWCCIYARRVA